MLKDLHIFQTDEIICIKPDIYHSTAHWQHICLKSVMVLISLTRITLTLFVDCKMQENLIYSSKGMNPICIHEQQRQLEHLPVSALLPGRPTWRPRSLTPPRTWRWGSGPWCWLECPWRTRRRQTPASPAHWGPFASSSLVFWVSWRCPLMLAVSPLRRYAKEEEREKGGGWVRHG